MKRAVRIGVTGKLGSGKSVLIQIMEEHGIAVIRSDDLARELMEKNATVRAALIQTLGPKAYANGVLDRAYIATQIFHDRSLLAKVESVVHPAVTKEVERIFRDNKEGMVAVESAIILKSKFREVFDYIVLVESPKEASVERVVKQGRLTREGAEARLAEQELSQQAHDEADFFIENAGSEEAFEEKCRKLIGLLEPLSSMELPDAPLHANSE